MLKQQGAGAVSAADDGSAGSYYKGFFEEERERQEEIASGPFSKRARSAFQFENAAVYPPYLSHLYPRLLIVSHVVLESP